jgi:hypothetical protein
MVRNQLPCYGAELRIEMLRAMWSWWQKPGANAMTQRTNGETEAVLRQSSGGTWAVEPGWGGSGA